MKIRQFFAAHAALVLLLPLFAPGAGAAEERPVFLDRIVAVVEKDVIMHSELRLQAQRFAQRLAAQGVTRVPSKKYIIDTALQELIDTKLMLAEAERIGLKVDEATLQKGVQAVARENRLSVAELQQALQSEGMSLDQFRDEVRTRLLKERLIAREVTRRIKISKAEVDRYIATSQGELSARTAMHLLHILIATPPDASTEQLAAARLRADDVMQRLQAGERFQAVAQEVSAGRQALQGGDLGWLDIDQVPGLFVVPASKMARNEIEGPLQNSGGFHIIKLLDYRGGDRNIVRQVQARHILIRPGESISDDAARDKLQKLYERILQGDDFAALARSNSDDTVTAIRGGELGWISPGEMLPEFEEQMKLLGEGEISPPFRSRVGWHILQVTGFREHDATEDAMLAKARLAVRDRKQEEALKLFVQRLRDEAFVDIRREDIEAF